MSPNPVLADEVVDAVGDPTAVSPDHDGHDDDDGHEGHEGCEGHKELYRRLAASVSVVTASSEHGPMGMTASSVLAVSLTPPLMLVSLAGTSLTLAAIETSGRFAVNLLADHQRQLAARFAGPRPGWVKFSGVEVTGSAPPVLASVLGGAICAVRWTRPAGDHTLVLGEVERHWVGAGDPLLWHRSAYHQIRTG